MLITDYMYIYHIWFSPNVRQKNIDLTACIASKRLIQCRVLFLNVLLKAKKMNIIIIGFMSNIHCTRVRRCIVALFHFILFRTSLSVRSQNLMFSFIHVSRDQDSQGLPLFTCPSTLRWVMCLIHSVLRIRCLNHLRRQSISCKDKILA